MSPVRPLLRRIWLAAALVACTLLSGRGAAAAEPAPTLGTEGLRDVARDELRRQLATLSADDARRLVGTYAVFEPDDPDAIAIPACDDDGDHVVALSDAMLRLVADVARLGAVDEVNGTRRVEDYATFLARVQLPGRKLAPPPPGSFAGAITTRVAEIEQERLREGVAFVVGHELARLRAGDVSCPRPTATREHGDATWTVEEQKRAMREAERVFASPTTQGARDQQAVTQMLASGRGAAGAIVLLRFFEQLERDRVIAVSRFTPAYLAHHPSSTTRGATVRAMASAAEGRRRAGDVPTL